MREPCQELFFPDKGNAAKAARWHIPFMRYANNLKALQVAKGWTIDQAAEAMGISRGGYLKIQRGENRLTSTTLDLAARAFGVTTAEIIGSPNLLTIPVMGRVGAGAQIEPEFEQVGPDGLFEVEIAIPFPPDMIGFEVVGDSMYPRYDDGDVVICSRDGEPQAISNGDEAAVRTSDGRRFLKKVMRSGEAFDLESHNAPPIRGVGLEWASPVVLTVHRSRWRKLGNGNGNGKAANGRKSKS